MNAAELGSKIKEARIAKKMTQSQVVGNFITRNMLSQIENGIAMPSINTLEYLAEVLDLPDILDFSSSASADGEHTHISDVAAVISAAKKAAKEENWQELAGMEESYPEELYDEFQALLAKAFLALAKSETSSPSLAAAYLRKSILYADRGIYANASVKAEAVIMLQQTASCLSSANDN